ncbi:MAG: M48 family metallopeptidase [Defluviitaleaceae bacterium]|nr:M48 family metallopeptidase [Defluviitaleaceae bacterium]
MNGQQWQNAKKFTEMSAVVSYTLVRSRRKTVAIYVRDGEVEVRAPLRVPKSEIERFVSEKESWILKIRAKQLARAEKKKFFAVDYGSRIFFRGKQYEITQNEEYFGFDGKNFFVPPNFSPQEIKFACIQAYKTLAKAHISERAAFFSAQMGVTPSAVKISGAKKRWGSCSSRIGKKSVARNNLNFSWRLMMADDRVIDYVTVHELAHLKEMNHSARFWAIVENVLPDFRERNVLLRELQNRLSDENWE